MRYAVDPTEVRRAADHVVRAARACRSVARHLETVVRGVPRGGATTSALPGIVARWRSRERGIDEALDTYAARLADAASAYERVETSAATAVQRSS